jgi:parallel beta helix pectate lyase-like protein
MLLLVGALCGAAAPVCHAPSSSGDLIGNGATTPELPATAGACDRFVSPTGSDRASGSRTDPWAKLEHAARSVRDAHCTVWFDDGVYRGTNEVERRFSTMTTFRAIHPYLAVFVSEGAALDVGGRASHIVFRGLHFRQPGPTAEGVLVYVSGSDDGTPAPSRIILRDNIFHDSWGDDLLKIRSAAHGIEVRGNVFYNQSDDEQHIDVNGVTNVTISGNIFFNDFGGGGRADTRSTKAFIVVKDSNGNADGFRGSRRIKIERNIFLRWQGGDESLIAIGNDGAPYLEARTVTVVNNLILGNGSDHADTAFSVSGAGGVSFLSNTVVGDLPSDDYAFNVGIKGDNPRNQDILFSNNIWCDPTGTMGSFANGDRADTRGLSLRRNLYWNGGKTVPGGDLAGPGNDPRALLGNPQLDQDQNPVVVPFWEGGAFRSGNGTISAEFRRLVLRYGAIPASSPAVGRAALAPAPAKDILGHRRDVAPDLGAFEVTA